MNAAAEWLEADGLGGYAIGHADGVRTRRHHALLVAATRGPTRRVALVHAFDAWVELPGATGSVERYAVSAQRYAAGEAPGAGDPVTHPDGLTRIAAFAAEPWPTWT